MAAPRFLLVSVITARRDFSSPIFPFLSTELFVVLCRSLSPLLPPPISTVVSEGRGGIVQRDNWELNVERFRYRCVRENYS